ncbi:MAG: hypothetical protein J5717_07750 [Lachnospiraceae bacterium]|nr:hypothetical protein [Lachnospiraceae bacterium]MBR5761184.1 hypothetical protein [Lachnospiraceae bacterium]MBR5993649.1 hypothetical protein [Lachnospiraceae bacterium]
MKKKLLSVILAAAMVLSFAGCEKKAPVSESVSSTEVSASVSESVEEPVVEEVDPDNVPEFAVLALEGKEYGVDYESLYDHVGKSITIADVTEDPDTGFAYITVDGEQKLLGLDFLTFAMVYNTEPAGEYKTNDEVYAAWWKYYITRWNALLPEIPLYSNEYYDLYNAQIKGVDTHPTNPYWTPAEALIDWSSEKAEKDIILGNTTELSGQFRYASFGKSNPGGSDHDIENMTNGLETVSKTKEGGYVWNDLVVDSHEEVVNEDGSKTFTIKVKDDLKFSDGSPITAKDFIARSMSFYTPVATQASGFQVTGTTVVGYEEFNKYTGPDSAEGTKVLSGYRLIDDYTFSVTIKPDYIPYFYDITYAGFTPNFRAMWIGDADIKDDGEGCYFTDDFYAKNGEDYVLKDLIEATGTDTSDAAYAKYPYSGAYCVKSFDTADSSAVLVKNEYFKGNYEGATPSIEKVIYKKVVSATQLEDFKAGGIDVISGITGGAATDEAIALADGSEGKYVYTHYSRAGYGKLGFRADYGPAQFAAVRQAIAFCMNRGQFAKDFTGGYGGVVDGPYYTGSWMYQEAVKQGMILNAYATSADSAIEVLKAGGWNYAADGSEYVDGVRYKKIPAEYATKEIKEYQSVDGTYKTTEVNGDYYMPLVINWYGTVDNEFTDLLQTGFKTNENVTAAGMVVYNTTGDFAPMLDELYQAAVYGYYSGSPMYCAFNFATSFSSAVYDYTWNLTINPSMYEDYSAYYIKDYADIYLLK